MPQRPRGAGEIAANRSTAAIAGAGHRRISQAARMATAIHMIWKYLFMSNSTALTTNRLGTRKSATVQAARNHRRGRPRPATIAARRRAGTAGRGWSGRRTATARGPSLNRASLQPRTCRNAPMSPCWTTAPAMNGMATHDRREEEEPASRRTVRERHATGQGDPQEHDEIGRREGKELERRQERREDPREQDARRALAQRRSR